MPTETAIVVVGIVLVFAVFAAALARTDYYTRNFRAPGAAYFEPERKFTAC
ncbi:MAG: hypothetical protein WBE96_03815 [Pseudolabrys sp.]